MVKPPFDADAALKKMASESVKQGENLRSTIRDLTLNALRNRELTLTQIKQVLKSVSEGVNAGAMAPGLDVEKSLAEALAGMDDALLQAVQAQQIALDQITGHGQNIRQTYMKKALGDLEKLEDAFLDTVKKASSGASGTLRGQWGSVLDQMQVKGTGTGAQAAAAIEEFGEQMRSAVRQQRQMGLKVAEAFSQNFATLASGILIGLSEGLQSKGAGRKKSSSRT